MSKLLIIDSSPLKGVSVTRELTATFGAQWKTVHPDGEIIRRDLTANTLPPLTANWVMAMSTPEDALSKEQKQELALSDTFLTEIQAASEWVIGAPLYNFGIPSVLKLWIDQIVRLGKTFGYVDGAPKGLITGKKVTIIVSTGGNYEEGSPRASFNHVEPYLKTIFGFLGVNDMTFYTVGGAAALRHGADRGAFLAPHIRAVQTLVGPVI